MNYKVVCLVFSFALACTPLRAMLPCQQKRPDDTIPCCNIYWSEKNKEYICWVIYPSRWHKEEFHCELLALPEHVINADSRRLSPVYPMQLQDSGMGIVEVKPHNNLQAEHVLKNPVDDKLEHWALLPFAQRFVYAHEAIKLAAQKRAKG